MTDERADSGRLGGVRSWYVLILLTLISAVSLLDRQVITILAVDIKRDLGMNDSEIGLVYGTFFAVFYALFSIPLGRLADGWVRTRQVALSLTAWSVATIGCAFATGFGSMSVLRAAVASGEAGAGPAAYSLVADLFPRRRRATAMAIYGASAALGVGLSMLVGGLVVGWWNGHFPGGRGWFGLVGWQAAFIVAALPGFLFAILILLVREPIRGLSDGIVQPAMPHPFRRAGLEFMALVPPLTFFNLKALGAGAKEWRRAFVTLGIVIAFIALATGVTLALTPPGRIHAYGHVLGVPISSHLIQWAIVGFGAYAALSWIQAQRFRDPVSHAVMWSSPAFIALLVVASFNLMINYGYTAFVAPYMIQHYGAPPEVIGPKIGLAAMISGGAGTILGGIVADFARRYSPIGRLWVLLFTTVVPVPLAFITFAQSSIDSFILWFLISSIILTGWLPCCIATLHDLVLPRMRGAAVAILYLGITIFGMGTGPYLVGLFSDMTGDLGRSILMLYAASIVVWIAILVAMRTLARDEASLVERARAAGEAI
ncbi:MAG TPA: MFS transporter [Sphingomonadaceae bacterium]|nr:MFS transporter [Sphingomonadaceae bacterium]